MESIATLHDLLSQQADRYGYKTFVHFHDREISYAELESSAHQLAAGLQELGLSKSSHIAVMLSNRPEYLMLDFAISKLGGVEVPINTAHKGDLLHYMLDQSDSQALIIEGDFVPQLNEVVDRLPKLKHVIVLGGDKPMYNAKKTLDFARLMSSVHGFEPVQVEEHDPFAILYTSGTTGPSKGAVLPHRYALTMAKMISERARYSDSDCLYNVLPLFHGNAKLLSTFPALLAGARMVLGEKFSASQLWDDVKRYGCTEFNYIGSILAILMKADERPDDADNSLRVMIGAGASPEIHTAFEQRFGVTLIEGYGMSEIGIPIISSMEQSRPGSCGKLHPDYEVKLITDAGADAQDGEPGELLIRPRNPWSMMLNYYNKPESTVAAWQNLWFHTGDYLQRDADGYYYFVDRKKDAIRRRGENISSFEVESLVNGFPDVLESAAVPVPSDIGEDEVMVCVVAKKGCSIDPVSLHAYCREQMAGFMLPRYIRVLEQIPKTPTQKIQKYQLREEGVTAATWDALKPEPGEAS